MIAIIDYDMGNIGSIYNMLKKIGAKAIVASTPDEIMSASKLILPGVGAFDQGMMNLEKKGLISVLNTLVLENQFPILGICLGMQLLSKSSEEGLLPGLGWIPAETKRFKFPNNNLKIPHMGWNEVKPVANSSLFKGFEEYPSFYFVHSYHVCCSDESDVLATCNYGYTFTAAIKRDNILGTQFHPEKSHKYGMQLLKNFAFDHDL